MGTYEHGDNHGNGWELFPKDCHLDKPSCPAVNFHDGEPMLLFRSSGTHIYIYIYVRMHTRFVEEHIYGYSLYIFGG